MGNNKLDLLILRFEFTNLVDFTGRIYRRSCWFAEISLRSFVQPSKFSKMKLSVSIFPERWLLSDRPIFEILQKNNSHRQQNQQDRQNRRNQQNRRLNQNSTTRSTFGILAFDQTGNNNKSCGLAKTALENPFSLLRKWFPPFQKAFRGLMTVYFDQVRRWSIFLQIGAPQVARPPLNSFLSAGFRKFWACLKTGLSCENACKILCFSHFKIAFFSCIKQF